LAHTKIVQFLRFIQQCCYHKRDMSRLPTPGQDSGSWGTILNDFLAVEHNTDGTLKSSGSLAAKADDTAVVHKAGAETITGVKTFSVSPLVPTPSSASQATTKAYVDAAKIDAWIFAKDYGVAFNGVTDDAANLQTAINAAIAADKPLILPPGTAIVGTTLTLTDSLTLLGSGRESTILKAKNALNGYVIQFNGSSVNGLIGAYFADFAIDGNSANQTSGSGGIKAAGAVQCTFERLHLTSCYDWGIELSGMSGGAFGHHNRVVQCLFDNAGTSAGFGGGVHTTSNDENWFYGSDFEFLGGASNPVDTNPVMLYEEAGLQYILACNFVSGSHNVIGIRIQNTKGTRIIGCMFDGLAGDGVYIAATKCLVTSCTFTGTGDAGNTVASSVHTQFGAKFNIISNNVFETSANAARLRSHIREEQIGSSGSNIIEGNTFSTVTFAPTVAAVESAGIATIVRNNIGWVTEATGTATIANATTSIAVNHTLDMTPTIANISLTPTNSLGTATKYWVSAVSATQFTITVDVNPGATTATFSWAVRL
jgi:hypothetical protein